jgi:hypothetical protein
MMLKSEGGQATVELRVLRYQFPEVANNEWDSNWLVLGFDAQTPTASWSRTDPCLLTWEAHWLLNWLDDLVSGTGSDWEMSFLEPNLSFTCESRHEGSFDLLVVTRCELLPPQAVSADVEEFQIRLTVSASTMRECISSFSTEVRRFPIRAGEGRLCRPYSDSRTDCIICYGAEPK